MWLRKLRQDIRCWIRRALLEGIFWLAYFLVTAFSLGSWRIWRRNSLALGYWTEKSDMDITLYSPSGAALPFTVRWLWFLFKPFGEWAAYTADDAPLSDLANPLELSRDPRLQKFFTKERETKKEEVFVFWLRMMDGDLFLRGPNAETRKKKWSFHLRQVKLATGMIPQAPYPECIDEIALRLMNVSKHNFDDNGQLPYLRPHRWLVKARRDGIEITNSAQVSTESLDVARAQFYWEAWGLLGQFRLRKNSKEVLEHLDGMARMFPWEDSVHHAHFRVKESLTRLENSSLQRS